jgi:hypothetical protein
MCLRSHSRQYFFMTGTTICRADDIMLQSDRFVVFIPMVTIHSTCVLKSRSCRVRNQTAWNISGEVHIWKFRSSNSILQSIFPLVSFVFLFHVKNYFLKYPNKGGTPWCSCLMYCAKRWKVAGSISDGVIGIVRWHNPSGRTMDLDLTQYLTEMSARNISWRVKVAGA